MTGITVEKLDAYRDERGWNAQPFNPGELAAGRFRNMHVVSLAPGAVRGNHVHSVQVELAVIVGGPCLFVATSEDAGERFERTFTEDELCLLTIKPETAHAFKNTSDHVIYLFCASDLAYNPDSPDSSSVAVIE